MNPTIGRVVIYTPTKAENEAWEKSSTANTAEKLPATIVAVWGETCINAQVILDGEGTVWKTSIQQGDGEGQWNWPVIPK